VVGDRAGVERVLGGREARCRDVLRDRTLDEAPDPANRVPALERVSDEPGIEEFGEMECAGHDGRYRIPHGCHETPARAAASQARLHSRSNGERLLLQRATRVQVLGASTVATFQLEPTLPVRPRQTVHVHDAIGAQAVG
jgi:hypothetical protein